MHLSLELYPGYQKFFVRLKAFQVDKAKKTVRISGCGTLSNNKLPRK